MKVLFIGDITGRAGRAGLAKALPEIKHEHEPDFVIANVENLAHGSGVTSRTLQEMLDLGIDCFTSGNHVWRKKEVLEILEAGEVPLVRPANYSADLPGCGYQKFKISQKNLFVLNLQGRVFMNDLVDNPFQVFDNLLEEIQKQKPDVIIVDFHAEATSEKKAFGYYADGRVQAVLGTHTHIQTADERLLEKGTAYITDAGFVGGKHTVLGVEADGIVAGYVTGLTSRHEFPESGTVECNAVLLDINQDNSVSSIQRITKEVVI